VTDAAETFVDTNVLLDLVTDDPAWFDWSRSQLDAAATQGNLAINEVVYAELSVRFQTVEALDRFVDTARLRIFPASRAALFLAGRAFQRYRGRGGTRTSPLPDFFIGAQAAVMGIPLLTRDAQRYRTYFPTLALIAP
jgi:predicted nucleic acid-binding protein